MVKLYVDDIRKCPDGWQLARTNTDAIRILAMMPVEEISIDHDIVRYDRKSDAFSLQEETFQPVAYYLAATPYRAPAKIIFHTANAWGARTMQALLSAAGLESTYEPGSYHLTEEEVQAFNEAREKGRSWSREEFTMEGSVGTTH